MPSPKLQRDRERLRMGYLATIHWTENDWSAETWEIVRNAAKRARVTIPWWVRVTHELRKFFIDDPNAFRKIQATLRKNGYKLETLQ